ncbi:hypothetical protein [Nostoc sp. FACHB-892]
MPYLSIACTALHCISNVLSAVTGGATALFNTVMYGINKLDLSEKFKTRLFKSLGQNFDICEKT